MTVGIPFGNYRLIRRLARGGMAEVFLATQSGPEGFERTVAVKRILPHLADSPQFVEMFMDEARLAAQLSHPNIAHIYEFGRVEDSYFIAMEYIDGIDLSAVVLDGLKQPLPLEHAARIIADVCAGLHYAHALTGKDGRPLNLVHRDISPQNILVSFTGSVKVVDFGIAKAAIHIERTRPGVVRGKYTYMAPEQVDGRPLDGRTDLFCAGIVLYELATADALFPRSDPIQAMRRIRACEIPKPARAGAALPPRLTEILLKALARRKEDRYRNAAEMQMDLEEYLRGAELISNSIVLGEYFTKHYRRFRPTPEQVRSSAEVRRGTIGVAKDTPPLPPKGTVAVAPAGSAQPSSDEENTLIVDGRNDGSSSSGEPPTILRESTEGGGSLHGIDTLIKPSPLVSRSGSYAPLSNSQVVSDRTLTSSDSEPKTLAFTGPRTPIVAKSTDLGSSIGGEIMVPPVEGPRLRRDGPTSVVDPSLADPTVVDAVAIDVGRRAMPPPRPASAAIPLRSLGRRVLIIGAVAAVGVAGILTGHWLSRPSASSVLGVADALSRTPDTGPPPDRKSVQKQDATTDASQGTLRVLSQPEGASVTVDGVEVAGTTPLSHPTSAGNHTVVASYPGFEDGTQKVRVESNQELTVKLTLRRLPPEQVVSLKQSKSSKNGKVNKNNKKRIRRIPPKIAKKAVQDQQGLLSISTIPWTTVFLGNRKIGITPFANVALPVGTHLLHFIDERGRSYSKRVTITSEKVTKLSFRLPGA